MPVARSPLHDWHVRHGARATEEELAIADLSLFAKTSLQGGGVAKLTEALLGPSAVTRPRGIAILPENQGLVCRLADDHLLLLSSTTLPLFADRLPGLLGSNVHQCDVTCAYASISLSSEQAEAKLRQLTALDLTETAHPVGTCAETNLAGVHALLVRLAASDWQLYVGWDVAEYVWESLVHSHAPLPALDVSREVAVARLTSRGW